MKLSKNDLKKYHLFVGPMSKNVVDSAIELSKLGEFLGLIPSRRQIENTGGYVNNWTTEEFVKYVRNRGAKDLVLQRDHGGPMQGTVEDNGIDSFVSDCNSGLNLIHVDPFKDQKVSSFEYAAKISCDLIRECLNENPDMLFEIGTEEAIFSYSHEYLDKFLSSCRQNLGEQIFQNSIAFAVVQCGTALAGDSNTGKFNQDRLKRMVEICGSHNVLSKEHNGDYLNEEEFRLRFRLGLDALNIAPEFGTDETKILLSMMSEKSDSKSKEDFYSLCHESRKWEKWIGKDFVADSEDKKEKLSICSGHYIFGSDKFSQIKKIYQGIDDIAFDHHTQKLSKLLGLINEEIS